jgi:hypothetical protein
MDRRGKRRGTPIHNMNIAIITINKRIGRLPGGPGFRRDDGKQMDRRGKRRGTPNKFDTVCRAAFLLLAIDIVIPTKVGIPMQHNNILSSVSSSGGSYPDEYRKVIGNGYNRQQLNNKAIEQFIKVNLPAKT